ncbi:hypothetical protein CHS0354_003637 [Potamilus streckersoni]|uniref:Magnesium transporter MgtE intracellular domain-containing protein n=1 Tax=Potamilus streckersoni TaxID=2493646 RepID=A0AAE0S8U7_9BIVA|nr:hypothetical protein CHS0354_003637 [Potamilus streckersoni]
MAGLKLNDSNSFLNALANLCEQHNRISSLFVHDESQNAVREQPFSEMMTVVREQQVSEIIIILWKQPVSEIFTVLWEQPVSEIMTVLWEQPVSEIMTVLWEQPVFEIMTVLGEQPASEIMTVLWKQPVSEIMTILWEQQVFEILSFRERPFVEENLLSRLTSILSRACEVFEYKMKKSLLYKFPFNLQQYLTNIQTISSTHPMPAL